MKTATLATYDHSIKNRLSGRLDHTHDEVNLAENEDLAKKWEAYYQSCGFKVLGRISFEDQRKLVDIARDFSKKLGAVDPEGGENYQNIRIPRFQRPIIQQAFVEYFLRR